MALEQNNTALDFEAMLRRQLSKKPGRTSIPESCDRFDADGANAYLENALSQTARTRYDEHLADCHYCRLQVIQLSRLIHQPQTEPQIATVIKPASIWSHWKSIATEWTEWLGFSSWQQGWATAGMAAAILIGVVSIQLWRQQDSQSSLAFNPAANSTPGNTSYSSQQTNTADGISNSQPMAETSRLRTDSGIPKPEVSPHPGELATKFGSANGAPLGSTQLEVSTSIPPSPPQVPAATNLLFSTSFASTASAERSVAALPAMPVSTASLPIPTPAPIEFQRSENVVAVQIAPSSSDNPMAKKKDKDQLKPQRSAIDKALGFMPTRKPANESKLEETPIEEDAPKVLTIRRRDKVFNYQGGFWVDSAYKPEMAWRVTKLAMGSDEYNQLLTAEPPLKEYFAHGPAIVMWKDKIYKVVGK